MTVEPSESLLKFLALMAHATGKTHDQDEARSLAYEYAADLAAYPERAVEAALKRCRRELRTFPTIADIIARIDDGRPGPQEAWAMIPHTEEESVVWTEEMRDAFDTVRGMISRGEGVAARMAFLETYTKRLELARARGVPVKWIPALGLDKSRQAEALRDAVRKGRMTVEHAQRLLPGSTGKSGQTLLDGPEEPIADVQQGVNQVLNKILEQAPENVKARLLGQRNRETYVSPAQVDERREKLKQQADLLKDGET